MTSLIDALDRGLVAALRALPAIRGKALVALRWKRFRERAQPLDGSWSLRTSDGAVFRAPRGSVIAWQLAAVGHWDGPLQNLLSRYVGEGSIVLDIGASIGVWTIPLARAAVTRGATVWAFEPNPANVRWLVANLEGNGLSDSVEVKAMGLGSAAGTATLVLCEHGGGNAAFSEHEANGAPGSADALAVQVERLDEFDIPRRVSFIKLDVEGFELEVLRGARELIERDRPVIFGEFSAAWLERRGEDLPGYLATLSGLGYQAFAIDEGRSAAWRTRDMPSLRALATAEARGEENLLLIPAAMP